MQSGDNCQDCKLCRLNRILALSDFPSAEFSRFVDNTVVRLNDTYDHTAMLIYSQNAEQSELRRTLRIICVWSYIPALILGIVHGSVSGRVFPALGLIPMTASTLFSLITLVGASSVTPRLTTLADCGMVAAFLGFLIPTWILLPDRWNGDEVMLGTYATVPMMLNFAIHVFLFVHRAFPVLYATGGTCQHCASGSIAVGQSHHQARYGSLDRKDQYDPIVATDNAQTTGTVTSEVPPRESTADETARLV